MSAAPAVTAETIDLFLRLRRHLGIAHHVPGRVRLRIGLGALGVLGEAGAATPTLEQLAPLFSPGTVRLNAQARSVIITYDPNRFPNTFWRDCLEGPDDAARAALADALPKTTAAGRPADAPPPPLPSKEAMS